MFKISFTIVAALFLLSCKNNNSTEPQSTDKGILYKWEWVKSEKFFPYYSLKTPATEGYSHQLEFVNDNQVKLFYADTLQSVCNYLIEDGLINLCSMRYTMKIMSDTLILSLAYIDGPTNYYIKL